MERQDSHGSVLLILSSAHPGVSPATELMFSQEEQARGSCVESSRGHLSSAHSSPASVLSESRGLLALDPLGLYLQVIRIGQLTPQNGGAVCFR